MGTFSAASDAETTETFEACFRLTGPAFHFATSARVEQWMLCTACLASFEDVMLDSSTHNAVRLCYAIAPIEGRIR